MTLGSNIRTARKAKGMTQAEVAEKLGISVQAVSQWETNKTVPGAQNLIDISKLLGMSLDSGIRVRDMLVHLPPPWESKSAVVAPVVEWETDPDLWGKDDYPDSFQREEFFDVHWKAIGEVFALVVPNFAMSPVFEPSDLIIIDRGRSPENGDYVVAKFDSHAQAILGVYSHRGRDSRHAPIFEIKLEESGRVFRNTDDLSGYIVGTVREHRRYYRRS